MKIRLLNEATATNGAPSAATDGFSLRGQAASAAGESNEPPWGSTAAIAINSTAGSGTMTGTFKLWVYANATAVWMPYGTDATAANKGLLNEGNAIGETGTDTIRHTELVNGLWHYDRVYLEITAIGGTGPAFTAYLFGR